MITLNVIVRNVRVNGTYDDLRSGCFADLVIVKRGLREPIVKRNFTGTAGIPGDSWRAFSVPVAEVDHPNEIEFFEVVHNSVGGISPDNWNATVEIQLGGPMRIASSGAHRYDGDHRVNRFFPDDTIGFFHEQLIGPPTSACWGEDRIDVFGLNKEGEVLQLWWDRGWHWANLGNHFRGTRFATNLAATSWGYDRIDVFGLNSSGQVLQLWWAGHGWNWSNLGNSFADEDQFVGGVTACSWGPNRIDVFGTGESGDMLQLWWDGRRWNWSNLGLEWVP